MQIRTGAILTVLLVAAAAHAAPLRVALLDFENETGSAPDAELGGGIQPAALTAKGPFLLGQKLVGVPEVSLIDRRDFTTQVENERLSDGGEPTSVRPSFLHAAQALRADAVVRGSILSFSTGKQIVNQGGYRSEFADTTLRIGLQALDAVDGSVLAMADGAGTVRVRQTEALQTVLGEDQVVELMNEALAKAVPELVQSMNRRQEARAARPRVALSVSTTADPALVEIDGILVGSTPLEGFSLYQGDHVLRVTKPGYVEVTKRILFESDTSIEVPMLRTDLTAEELYEIYKNADLSIFEGVQPALIIDRERVTGE